MSENSKANSQVFLSSFGSLFQKLNVEFPPQRTSNPCTRSTITQRLGRVQDLSYRDKGIPYSTRPGISQTARPVNPQRIVDYPVQMYCDLNRPHLREDPMRNFDKAFNAYGERLRADLRGMHGVCTQLIAQEKQEAAKWYAMCARAIVERDQARKRFDSLTNGAGSPSSAAGEVQNTGVAGPLNSKHRGGSSGAQELSSTGKLSLLHLPPVHSPPESPPPSPHLSTSPASSSAMAISPTLPHSTISPSSSHVEVSQFGQRPVKRRKSCEVTRLIAHDAQPGGSGRVPEHTLPCNLKIKQQSRTPSPLTLPTDFPSDFSHVDLMYVSVKGMFVCRACL